MHVSAINRDDGLLLLDDDRIIPIDSWHDEDGNVCSPDEAWFVTATVDGKWLYAMLDDYYGQTLH